MQTLITNTISPEARADIQEIRNELNSDAPNKDKIFCLLSGDKYNRPLI